MKFRINSRIFEKFPGLNIGIIAAKGIDNQGDNGEIINRIREKEKEIRAKFDTETLPQNPEIDAWRKAYSLFGANPKKYKCSVENLYRMILKGMEVRRINKVVDVYNYISIKYMVPVGGDDIDKVDGNIVLRFARGNETFIGLNSGETKNPKEGEVVYADDKEVLCRRWNWRECDKSKMTEKTKNIALVVEGLPPVTKEDVRKITDELSTLIQNFCGGKTKTFILNSSNPEADI